MRRAGHMAALFTRYGSHALALLLCVGCASLEAPEDDGRLRVLVWNAWRGGNEVDQGPEKALALVRAVDPDLVLMQESYDIVDDRPTLGRWIAAELGWTAHQGASPHLCLITRHDLDAEYFHDGWHGVGARITDPAGRSLIAWSIWLDYREYLPYALRDDPGLTDAELLACESERSGRLDEVHALLAAVEAESARSPELPVLVGGDFNTPSHLDWTTDTARVYRYRRALQLPVSLELARAGFTDAFRAVHPNPVQHPGITWTPLFRGSGQDEDACFDRIDRLYTRPGSRTGAPLLRPSGAYTLPEVWEDDRLPVRERRFPSDHAALVVELNWTTAGR
jgi:hypothetical protein